ncbi:hypothetical protein Hanom_Chr17g01571971 [Helianthus anomalus]
MPPTNPNPTPTPHPTPAPAPGPSTESSRFSCRKSATEYDFSVSAVSFNPLNFHTGGSCFFLVLVCNPFM